MIEVYIICSCVNVFHMANPHCDDCEGTGLIEYSDEPLCEEENFDLWGQYEQR